MIEGEDLRRRERPAGDDGRRAPFEGAALPQGGSDDGPPPQPVEILEHLSDAVLALDDDWRITYANRAACDLVQCEGSAVLGETFWRLFAPVEGTVLAEKLREVMSQRRSVRFEHIGPITGRWRETSIDPAGRGVSVHSRDIHDRKEAERRLRLGEMRLQSIIDNVAAFIYVKDPEGRLLLVNRHLEETLGIPREQLLGRREADFFPAEFAETFAQHDRRVIETGESLRVEETAPIGGEPHAFLSLKFPLRDASGEIYAVCGVSTDIEDRNRSEQLLQAAGKQLQFVTDLMPAYLARLDAQGRYIWGNQRYAERFGLSPQELVGRSAEELLGDYYRRVEPYILRVLSGETVEFEDQISQEAPPNLGGSHWVHVVYSPTHNPQGDVDGFLAVVTDITARKELEQAVRRSEQRYRTLTEAITSIVWTMSPEGLFLDPQPPWEEYTGQVWKEYCGSGWEGAIHTADRERVVLAFEQACTVGQSYHADGRIWHAPSGGYRFCEVRAVPLLDADGKVREWIGTMVDVHDRRVAELALRESELRHRMLMELLPVGIYMCDVPHGRLRYYNRRAAELWGREPEVATDYESACGEVMHFLRPEKSVLGEPAPEGPLPQTGLSSTPVRNREAIIEQPDGSQITVLMNIDPVIADDGQLVGSINVFQDVTERKHLFEALRESEERLRLAQQAARIGAFEWDLRTGRLVWSPELLQLYGLSAEQFGGTYDDWKKCVHPSDWPRAEKRMYQSLITGEYDCDFRIVCPSQEVRWLYARAQVERNAAGEPLRMVGVNVDITERKQAEEALRRSEQLYRSIGESINYGIWVADPEGRNNYASESFLELVGFAQNAWSKASWKRLLEPADAERHAKAWRECVAAGSNWEYEYRFQGTDGQTHYILSRGVPVRHDGAIVYYAGIHLDIGGFKQIQQQLQEADRRKDEFLATLAHELRNPLAPVRNATQVLKLKPPEDEDSRWAAEVIERQVEHLTHLVDDLLDVSRITRGKVTLRRERLDVQTVFDRALETSRPAIESFRHRLSVQLPDEPLEIDADLTRLAQVLANLLNNSAKYTPPGGEIALRARRDDHHAVLSVEDNGIGIPPQMLGQIFDMFAQVDTSLERSQGGLGIGLTIVRRLVEMHGGTVSAESPGVDRGSTFTVRLPLAPEPTVDPCDSAAATAEEEAAAPADEPVTGPKRVLVVDDNRDSAESLAMLLRLHGHEVRTAHGGWAGLEAAAEFSPDTIFLDIGMPDLNGYEVATRLRTRQQDSGAPLLLVAMTGWGQEADRLRSQQVGFDRHLVKPVEPDALLEILGR